VPSDKAPPKPPPVADRAERLDLLLAEDNDVNRMIMARMRAVLGWSVTEVASGGAAVQAAATRAFDVMLFDLHMPDGDGPDALSEIRRGRGPSANAAALLITADVDASALNERELEQFAAVLVKPVDIDGLRDAVLGAIQPA
jgi:CheY-like chemotaxis protein